MTASKSCERCKRPGELITSGPQAIVRDEETPLRVAAALANLEKARTAAAARRKKKADFVASLPGAEKSPPLQPLQPGERRNPDLDAMFA